MHMTRRAPELSATSRLVCIWIMMLSSPLLLRPLRILRSLRLHDLLLVALDHFPALEPRQRPALLDPDDITHRVLVLLIVRVVFLRPPDGLLQDRMGEAALDAHHHGLVLLVAHDDALEHTLRHLAIPLSLGLCSATLLRRNSLDPRDVATHRAHPRRILELVRRPLESQVELLLLELEGFVVELVDGHRPHIGSLHGVLST